MSDSAATTDVADVIAEALAAVSAAPSEEALDELRVAYLGRRGRLTGILRSLGALPPERRRDVGSAANQARDELEASLEVRQNALRERHFATLADDDRIDVTLPGWPQPRGGLHPVTRIVREILEVFTSMGFSVAEGPEVELDHYNFEMLNIPRDHPARDMWNTFWIEDPEGGSESNVLLRTHTSPMQARIMENTTPPVRVVVPGKCYRYEATDATHEWHFYQVEGLAVDKGITFANLRGTLNEFAQRIFGEDRRIRFRCDYFPFVEPGVEMSIDCFKCGGDGCRVCSHTGWIEIMGAGMVHPKVLEGVGYDPAVYTGFAFGMGPERIAMLKYGIDDVRMFYANDLRFLKQAGRA